jgi:uncharacterized protein involved in type VI secretion and phage assembly
VRVKFPGIDSGQQSWWARVSSLGAGSSRGSSIRPEVNDEVLVTFEGGDVRKPVVLGSLFTTKSAPPDLKHAAGKFSRSTLLHQFGHQIVFWDENGKTGVEVRLKNDASLLMNEEGIELKGGGQQKATTITQGESSIELKTDGTITIKGVKIVLQAQTDVELKASAKVVAQGTAGVDVKGAMVQIKADGIGKLEAGGVLQVKGAVVQIN